METDPSEPIPVTLDEATIKELGRLGAYINGGGTVLAEDLHRQYREAELSVIRARDVAPHLPESRIVLGSPS